MTPHFQNTTGFSLTYDAAHSSWWTTVYEFALDPVAPLTFLDRNGDAWEPNRRYHTDQGSIPRFPPFVRMLIPKDRFLGFYLHDSGYVFGGLWKHGAFRVMTRKQVDDLLYDMIRADPKPGWRSTAWTIWSHVRMYGGLAGWCKGDRGKKMDRTDWTDRTDLEQA